MAKDWFHDHKESDWWTKDADAFLNYLKKGSRILDVGCGAGLKSKYLVQKGFKVVGIDFSEEMIQLAKQYVAEAKFLVWDITQKLTFKEKFDGVFAQAVLLHIPKKDALNVLKNLVFVLNPGGLFWLSVKEQKTGMAPEELVKENDYGYAYERFFSFFTLPEIKEYMQKLGMQVLHENIVLRGEISWLLVIARKHGV